MPKILTAEILQLLVYAAFGVFIIFSRLKKPLYFALGFVTAIGIPALLLGFGFKGMKAGIAAGSSAYEQFRGLPVANGLWGLIHFMIAVVIYLQIKDEFEIGLNLPTFLLALGFCFVYIPLSIMQGI